MTARQQRLRRRPPPHCQDLPSSIQLLARHGARHTGKPSDLTELGTELIELGSPLPWLRNYSYPGNEEVANNLIEMGKEEHKGIGARLGTLFGEGFFEDYNPNFLMINSTTLSRTGQSATSFCSGAGIDAPFVRMDSTGRDDILRFYDHCEAWDDNADSAAAPYKSYAKTRDFKSALEEFSTLAELPPGVIISAEQFNRAFEACAYDLILSSQTEEWCSLFSEGSLDVANYVTDLKKFYSYGPGFSINRDFTAFLVKSIIEGLESDTKGTLRFAHAETVIPFLSAIGIFDGQEPLGDVRRPDRSFKMNEIAPFSANVVLAKYSCKGDSEDLVKFLVNEAEITTVRGCNGNVYCPVSSFKSAVSDLLERAQTNSLDEICTAHEN